MRASIAMIVASTVLLAGGPASARDIKCRDAKGHIAKCPPAAPAKVTHTSILHRLTKRTTTTTHSTAASAPGGKLTAKCKDGSLSYSKTHSGSCSHHGGVATWM